MKDYYERLRVFWTARQPREKIFLIGLSAFAIVALLVQLLWSSHYARDALKKRIPQLQQNIESLQRKAADMQTAKSRPAAAAPAEGNALLTMAIATAEAAGLREARSQLKLEAPRRVRMRGTVPFDRWVEWISVLQRDGQVRLVSCRIQASAAHGAPEIDALFALPDPS